MAGIGNKRQQTSRATTTAKKRKQQQEQQQLSEALLARVGAESEVGIWEGGCSQGGLRIGETYVAHSLRNR